MSVPQAYYVSDPHPSVPITNAPPPMTMSEEDADLIRTTIRGAVGKWIADDAHMSACLSVTNNAYTFTYVGSERGYEIEGHFTVKCCCCTVAESNTKGTFDENGLGGETRNDDGLKMKYSLVSLDKVHKTATYAMFGQDKHGRPVTGTAVQSQHERRTTLNMHGAPPGGLTVTYRR